jgi:hypothetical protein
MCRSIKILRTPYAVSVTEDDVRAAALQYVQTVSGFRLPPPEVADAFDRAVNMIMDVTRELLAAVEPGGGTAGARPVGGALHGLGARIGGAR